MPLLMFHGSGSFYVSQNDTVCYPIPSRRTFESSNRCGVCAREGDFVVTAVLPPSTLDPLLAWWTAGVTRAYEGPHME